MKRTEVSFDIETIPLTIRQFINGATIYDSSCSEHAKTLFVSGSERAFLKISKRGTLEREYHMTKFLHQHNVAPNAIAYESDLDYDYLFTEAVSGEDGTAELHLENPRKLACVFGEYLKMLHSLPIEGCPYGNRTHELLNDAQINGIDLNMLNEFSYSAIDNVVIHGDYCLPNIIMDHFSFKGFIDLGYGGVGDRHYDIYWGIWTLNYNLKTDTYRDIFLDAYGRSNIDDDGLNYFTKLNKLTD
ncbi:aminoglycoside 3'-phosphotransferase [Paenibacillus rigui]|uniref:Aminoglycoside phosphotransferase n=1 Tax=Paenibacillus rigui TaxID=554312 RepID=A0A229UZF4_9BACL|nr:aminoglycoside 3'-phosphotransferase [Paenibacillus rigui]OXM88349.1 aminoglycoside phosphotransferase [Paenibacillus rigui]